jgi:hypothetical protein
MTLLNSTQLALYWLLCEGGTDTSHLELSLGTKKILWWDALGWRDGKCTLMLDGAKTINVEMEVYAKRVESFHTAKVTIRSNFVEYPYSYINCYDVRILNERLCDQRVITFNDAEVVHKFALLFKTSTGLNPFAFS